MSFSPKLSGRQEVTGPLFNLIQRHIESRTDDTTLVQTAIQVDNNLSSSVVIHNLKFPYVACRIELLQLEPITRHTTATHASNSTTFKRYYLPCFIITVRNLTITLEQGLMSTCLLPRFSALHIDTRASFNTLIRTMAAKEQYH